MSPRPRIGITSWTRPVSSAGTPEPNETVPRAYVRAVERAGGLPILLPVTASTEVAELLDVVHGVVVSGGGDVDPARYGATPASETSGVDEARDAFDLALWAQLLESAIPTLAVCRGVQILNVALGGSLHQHLPEHDRGTGVTHRAEVDPGSALAGVLGTNDVEVNSLHHQSIDRLGDAVRVIARAPDGVVEAIEIAGHPSVLAVQWHPELLRHRPEQLALFEDLVRRSGSR